jgi:hypothetical protein
LLCYKLERQEIDCADIFSYENPMPKVNFSMHGKEIVEKGDDNETKSEQLKQAVDQVAKLVTKLTEEDTKKRMELNNLRLALAKKNLELAEFLFPGFDKSEITLSDFDQVKFLATEDSTGVISFPFSFYILFVA